LDCTAGGGGHLRALLAFDDPALRVVAFDQDQAAIAQLPDDPRLTAIQANFSEFEQVLDELGIEAVDGVLADLGVSSHHFDTPERGFSFRFDAPLDMRMNPQSNIPTAAQLLNEAPLQELRRWLRELGEIHQPSRVAKAIDDFRQQRPFKRTIDLNEVLAPFTPARHRNTFLAQVYQALRIVVNREIEALETFLQAVPRRLRSGGALVILSYHSLEDRRVKHFFRSGNLDDIPQRDIYGNLLTPWRETSRKAIQPDESEIERNPRSRSARLRWGIKA
jgi:16S rRNA (cytosine1402-N4)-methyltransferase